MSTRNSKHVPLGHSGQHLWDSVTRRYELSKHEEVLLGSACRLADTIADLEAALTSEGLIVQGSQGQPRVHPAVSELRQNRLVLARLVADLGLPLNEAAQNVKLPSPASQRASHAVQVRHDRERLRIARAEGGA